MKRIGPFASAVMVRTCIASKSPAIIAIAVCVMFRGAGTARQAEFPVLTGPYLGQKPPGMTPEIFAPGIVSILSIAESWLMFSPDGKEIYFFRGKSVSDFKRYVSKMENGIWTIPEPMTFDTGYVAGNGHITFDNKKFYFNWQRPVPEGEAGYPARGGIYFAKRTQNGWSEPKYAGQGHPLSSTRDGQLFCTDMSSRSATGQTYFAKVEMRNGYLEKGNHLGNQGGVPIQKNQRPRRDSNARPTA